METAIKVMAVEKVIWQKQKPHILQKVNSKNIKTNNDFKSILEMEKEKLK